MWQLLCIPFYLPLLDPGWRVELIAKLLFKQPPYPLWVQLVEAARNPCSVASPPGVRGNDGPHARDTRSVFPRFTAWGWGGQSTLSQPGQVGLTSRSLSLSLDMLMRDIDR